MKALGCLSATLLCLQGSQSLSVLDVLTCPWDGPWALGCLSRPQGDFGSVSMAVPSVCVLERLWVRRWSAEAESRVLALLSNGPARCFGTNSSLSARPAAGILVSTAACSGALAPAHSAPGLFCPVGTASPLAFLGMQVGDFWRFYLFPLRFSFRRLYFLLASLLACYMSPGYGLPWGLLLGVGCPVPTQGALF